MMSIITIWCLWYCWPYRDFILLRANCFPKEAKIGHVAVRTADGAFSGYSDVCNGFHPGVEKIFRIRPAPDRAGFYASSKRFTDG